MTPRKSRKSLKRTPAKRRSARREEARGIQRAGAPARSEMDQGRVTSQALREQESSLRVPIVGVGASAGGLEAFTELLKHLPMDTGLGFVLVQHLDPQHESALTQLLARATLMPVREVTNNLRVEANSVYVIPPNTNLTIVGGVLKLQRRQHTRTPTRSIDAFLESLAQDRRERAIGVILSGTASDGTLGLEAIKAEGGITFAQNESARYDSMPRSAVAAGCVDFVLRPEGIAKELARIAKHPYVAGTPTQPIASPEADRTTATAHEDDDTALPSGDRGTPSTLGGRVRAEAEAAHVKAGENGYKKGSAASSQPLRRGFLPLQIHDHPAARHPAHGVEQTTWTGRLRRVSKRQCQRTGRPVLRCAHQRDEFFPEARSV